MTPTDRDVPLWSLLKSRNEFGAADLPLLTVVSRTGVHVRDLRDGRAPSEDLAGYRVVEVGDLVVNKLWARFGAYGVSPVRGIISPAYWVLRITSTDVSPPFLHYLLRSQPYRAEIARRSKDLPPNGFDLSWEQFRRIPIRPPSIAEQHQITDFLDVETARINALIAKKRRQANLLEEQYWSFVESLVGQSADHVARHSLRRIVAYATDGPFGSSLTSAHYSDTGARVIRLGNLGRNEWRNSDRAFVPMSYWASLGRHHSQPGDIIIAALGDDQNPVGRASVVPNAIGPAMVKADCFCIRLVAEADATFIALYLSSASALSVADRLSDGATRRRLTLGKVLSLPVPTVPASKQRAAVAEASIRRTRLQHLTQKLERQIELLHERRQALITAAVTGQIPVPA